MQKNEVNVLIVEDDVTQREALSEAVKRKGFRAVPVGKPDEAVSLAKVKPIHALIVDCMLPGINGVDLAVRLKQNLVDGAPIILVSGIYRDKNFAAEAVKKTEAIEFLYKPFDIEKVMTMLDKSLSSFFDKPKVDLHALLAAPSASARERKKALDHVEEMYGYDLPFVLCILMDAESSGHLNIVDDQQNIYGITLAKGTISKVDSEKTALMTKKLLVSHGFITELDLSELTAKNKSGDLLRNLINEGLMSPHVVDLIKREQIATELVKLLDNRKLTINFVPDRKIKEDLTGIDMNLFINQLHDQVAAIPVEYLKKFYQVWAGHAMRLGPQYQDQIHILGLPLVKACDGLIEFFKRDSTLEDIIASGKYTETNLFHALHFLALRRVFVFEEVRRVANVDEHIGRLKSMHKVLQGKNPIEVFAYFGLDESTRIADITRFYREFAKSNHPDTLPQSISEEFRKMNHELFSWVTSAHDILSNEEKKKIFTESLKQKEAEMQLRAEDLASEARSMMGRGKFSEALTKLSEAKALYSSDTIELNYLWARLKAPGKMTHDALIEADSFMQSVSPDIKKLALYLFVKGLLFAAKGQNQEAVDFFLRALKVDPELSEARRELSAFKTSKKNDDFLTGDITAVFSNLLKRKKSG
jgi:CheY-like chemotaxis protein